MRSFIICTLSRILLQYTVKENEMSGACNMHGGYEKRYSDNLKRRGHLETGRRWEDSVKNRSLVGWLVIICCLWISCLIE
jgi:hypothetical protein